MRSKLKELQNIFILHEENDFAGIVNDALIGTEQELTLFLKSNELWGGSGSIADQAGVGQSREVRKSIQAALISLGETQIKQGILNVRTQMWVETFRKWQHGEL